MAKLTKILGAMALAAGLSALPALAAAAAPLCADPDPAVAEAVRAFQMAQRRRVLDADRDRQGGPAGV